MPYIQNADASNYYELSGIANMAPGAVIWVSQELYDNSAVIAAALIAGEIIDFTGEPQPSDRIGDMITAIGSNGDLRLAKDTYRVTQNKVIPEEVRLVFEQGAMISVDGIAISAITKANPGEVTTSSVHNFSNGDKVRFKDVGGMVELNYSTNGGVEYTVTVVSTTKFTIGVNTSGYTTYTSGGYAQHILIINGNIDAGLYQVFTGNGGVSISGKVKEVYAEWFGAIGNGVIDDTNALQNAILSGPLVHIKNQTYMTTPLNMRANLVIKGEGDNSILKLNLTTSGSYGVLTGSDFDNIEISNITFDTNKSINSANVNLRGLLFIRCNNLRLANLKVMNANMAGIDFRGCDLVKINNVHTYNNGHNSAVSAGICIRDDGLGVGSSRVQVKNCSSDTDGRPDISEGAGLQANVATDITVSNYHAKNATKYGVKILAETYRVTLSGIIVQNSLIGIGLPSSNDFALTGFIIDTVQIGIDTSSATNGVISNGVIKNVTGSDYAIKIPNANNIVIGGIVITNSVRGIRIQGTAARISLVAIEISNTEHYGILIENTADYITLDNIQIYPAASKYGLYITSSGTHISISNLLVFGGWGNVIPIAVQYGSKITHSITDTSTSGTGEDDLKTTSIPAGLMGADGGIKMKAAGIKTGANGNKTIKLYWGTASWTIHAAANNTNAWRVEAEIINVSHNNQRISWICWDGATALQNYATSTQETDNAVVLKLTGECANAADVITQTMLVVERAILPLLQTI